MGQEMDNKIRQISGMLSNPEATEGLRQLISSLNSSGDTTHTQTTPQSIEQGESEFSFSDASASEPPQETDWIYTIQNMLSKINSIQDSRINLLRSVHPFLNTTRKARCNTCVNILKVAEILRALTNNSGRLL